MAKMMKGYEVEWCEDVPKIPGTDENDLDNAKMCFRDFATLKAARAFARKIVGDDWFGSVRITPFALEPFEPGFPGLTREYTADPEYIEAHE